MDHRNPTLPIRSDIFHSTPVHIRALLRALKWTRYELGRYCGVYCLAYQRGKYKVRTSLTVTNWTNGKHVPSKPYRQRMVQLAESVRPAYLQALKELTGEDYSTTTD